MASKGALKKKKALERRLKKHPLKISTITDLGEYLQEFFFGKRANQRNRSDTLA